MRPIDFLDTWPRLFWRTIFPKGWMLCIPVVSTRIRDAPEPSSLIFLTSSQAELPSKSPSKCRCNISFARWLKISKSRGINTLPHTPWWLAAFQNRIGEAAKKKCLSDLTFHFRSAPWISPLQRAFSKICAGLMSVDESNMITDWYGKLWFLKDPGKQMKKSLIEQSFSHFWFSEWTVEPLSRGFFDIPSQKMGWSSWRKDHPIYKGNVDWWTRSALQCLSTQKPECFRPKRVAR